MTFGTDVVFTFSFETLDDAIDRQFCRPPDQLLKALAGADGVRELVVVDAERSLVVDRLKGRGGAPVERVDVAGRVAQRVRPRRFLPPRCATSTRLPARYQGFLRDVPAPDRAAVVTYNPFVAAWSRPSWASSITYVGRDDWCAFEPMRRWWPAFRAAYREIDRSADHIFAISAELAARLSDRCVVIPNGIDESTWRPRRRPPGWREPVGRPCGVYTGTIDARLDLAALDEAAEVLREVVIAGPVPDVGVRAELAARDYVRMVGPVGQDDLAALVQDADVALLPHVENDLTRAMSPLKLFEYAAAGLPVVAADLPPIRDADVDAHLCGSGGDWAPAVKSALREGRADEEERQRRIDQLGWSARLAPVLRAVTGAGT